MPAQVHIQLNNRLLPLLVVLVAVVRIFDSYSGWTVLLVTLGGAWLICWLWARSLARHLRLKREVRFGWVQVGDRLEDRFTLVNEGIFPALWVEVIDHSTMPGYRASCATGVSGSSENSWTSDGICSRRGLFTHGPTTINTSDPFGIYSVKIHHPQSVSLMVAPPVGALNDIRLPFGGWSGEGKPRAHTLERTISTAGVRPYLPGDQLRWIHWRTTARLSDLYVRLFDGIPAGDWWIILDLSESSQAGTGQESTLEHSVILAACLATHGIRQGKAVGLAVNGVSPAWLTPRSGDGQRWEILHQLALAEAGDCSLDRFLASLISSRGLRTNAILVTADLSLAWVDELFLPAWQGRPPLALLLNSDEYLPEPASGMERRAAASQRILTQFGFPSQVIERAWFDRPEFRPGKLGAHDWKITPRGRALQTNQTADHDWRSL